MILCSCQLFLTIRNRLWGLAEPWASKWPELAHTPFFLAVGDGVGANLGSGCSDSSRIALTIGTTGAMRVVLPNDSRRTEHATAGAGLQPTPAGLWSYPIDSSRWLVGGSLTDGGSLFSWLHETLAVEDTGALLAAAAALPPDHTWADRSPVPSRRTSPRMGDRSSPHDKRYFARNDCNSLRPSSLRSRRPALPSHL